MAQWGEGVYPGDAQLQIHRSYSGACFHKQTLLSADIADRVPESSETGATTASVKIGSSPSQSLGLLRPET